MYSSVMVDRDLERKYYDLKQEISRVFGWEEYDWQIILGTALVEGLIKFKRNRTT